MNEAATPNQEIKMSTNQKTPQNVLEDIRVTMKLAALWTSLMFFIIYLDYFHLYMPGSIQDILAGRMFVFDITQVALLAGLGTVTIPALMIFLSVALPRKVNLWTNMIAAAINIPLILFNMAGVTWIHMVFGAVVQVVLLLLIIRYSWKLTGQENDLRKVELASIATKSASEGLA
jgi:hypothetical protein